VADYLEAYAARFDLPVRTGLCVERLSREGDAEHIAEQVRSRRAVARAA
jgi:hypothetical protein